MSDVAAEARVERKFEIEIIYNGVEKKLKVDDEETVKQVLDHAIRIFSVTQQPHLLALYTAAGDEITNESQTLKQAGIRPHDKLLLRPSKVRGGAV